MDSSGSVAKTEKQMKDHRPHAVFVPFPTQGHVNPMMKLAKLLHHRGFHVTFVNSEYNHRRILESRGPSSLDGASSFRFASIPDGLPFSDARQDFLSLFESLFATCLDPFKTLLARLNDDESVPPVSCIVWDSLATFAHVAAEELRISDALFWPGSASGFLLHLYLPRLLHKGLVPLRDTSLVDSVPGMKNMRWKDCPPYIRAADLSDVIIRRGLVEIERLNRASALVLNTFQALEHHSLSSISSILPCPIYSVGPLQLLDLDQNDNVTNMGSNLFKEETNCLQWLDAKEPGSVLYVNFGTTGKMTLDQVKELAWGIANSRTNFLWVIRPELVSGGSALLLPPALFGERGLAVNWCSQVDVLEHEAVGGFLTHCGWNSVTESICAGVPLICWPFMADQHPNRRNCCAEWGIGLEIDEDNVKREDVEKVVREMMEGERGKEMKKKALEWKEVAREATKQGSGSSWKNLDKLVTQFSKTSMLAS